MSAKVSAKMIGGCLTIFLVTPLWYFITYRILVAIHADPLTWGAFWAYVPLSFILRLVVEVATEQEGKKP